jgi:hypothetical protein
MESPLFMLVIPVVFLIIFLLLYKTYNSFREPSHVILAVPFAFRSAQRFRTAQNALAHPYLDAPWNFNHLFTYTQCDLFRLGHAMPYMIPYYQSGLLVSFRCTDCDWTYTIQNPCSAPIPREEEEHAKKRYVTHRCSEFSSKTTKK